MAISALMAMCLTMEKGKVECQVMTRYSQFATSTEACTAEATKLISKIAEDTGRQHWSDGVCFPQDKYETVVSRAVEFLQIKGYAVELTER